MSKSYNPTKFFTFPESFYTKITTNDELSNRLKQDLLDFIYKEQGEQV